MGTIKNLSPTPGIVCIPENVPLPMLVVPEGAGRRKLLSDMKLNHGVQNNTLLRLLVLQLFRWLLPFWGCCHHCSCVPAATDTVKDLFEANQAVGFVCCFPVTFCPKQE